MTTSNSLPLIFDGDDELHLFSVAHAWLGTPFAERQGIKGAGVDCVHLVAAIMQECGAQFAFSPPYYRMDQTVHYDRSFLAEYLDQCPLTERLTPGQPPQAGDIVTLLFGRAPHHCGVVLDYPRFIHSARPVGVVINQLDDAKLAARVVAFYRPLSA